MVMLFSWIVASGDNILFGLVQESVQLSLEGASAAPQEIARRINEATTAFYSDLYFWINTAGLLLQAFFVSRILRYGGFMALMLASPLVSLTAYLSMAVAPVIGLIKAMKVAENSSNYSVNNTARHMLWLPVSKEMLYQAKTAIDTPRMSRFNCARRYMPHMKSSMITAITAPISRAIHMRVWLNHTWSQA